MADRIPDFIIITGYLILIAFIGIRSGGKQRTIKDYFLGAEEIPWLAVSFSIVAAETSTLTFISIPGLAYLTNSNFLQVTFGYLIGRIVVAAFFLPSYYKGEIQTVYTFLQNRYGKKARTFGSIVFLITRVASDGVRLFATAIPLYLLLDIHPILAIVVITIIALVYTYTGGLKAIIWVDAIQMFIYLAGALIAIFYLLNIIPGGIQSVFENSADKFSFINLGFDLNLLEFFKTPYTLIAGIIGGAFLSMASHGTDQLIVQRLLAIKNLKKSKTALISTGVMIIFQFALFLFLGVLLYAYYGQLNVKSDEIFPMFIIEVLPAGLTGVIIAGILAAALSTMAGSMSSLSSSTILDLILPFAKKDYDDKSKLKISRAVTILWAALLICSAIFFKETSQTVVELALSISSFTFGGMLGTFLLGMLNKKVNENDAILAFAIAISIMIFVILFNLVAWTWYIFIGVLITLITGTLSQKISVFFKGIKG